MKLLHKRIFRQKQNGTIIRSNIESYGLYAYKIDHVVINDTYVIDYVVGWGYERTHLYHCGHKDVHQIYDFYSK